MTVHGLTRTVALPLGFRARFTHTVGCEILVEWFPSKPKMIRSWAERRRFLAVFGRAKEAFIAEIEVLTGARVDAADYIDELDWEDPPKTGRPQTIEPKVGSRRG
jgi:hypothetical protein